MSALDIAVTALALEGLAWPVHAIAGRLRAGQCPCSQAHPAAPERAAGVVPVPDQARPRAQDLPALAPRPGLPALPDGPDMPRADAARLLGITDRATGALCAAGVLEGIPYDGRPARVTTDSVNRFLASRNGSKEGTR